MKRWGATPKDWEAFINLTERDIWPTVCNPNIIMGRTRAEPGGKPAGGAMAKVPSTIGEDGKAYRLAGWTKLSPTKGQLARWQQNPDLGLGMVCRAIQAIDLDIDDPDLADEVDEYITEHFGELLPARRRYGSPRRLLLYRIDPPERRRKAVIHTAGGDIEFQMQGQFVSLAGVHESGHRQVWPDGIPETLEDIPSLSNEELTKLIEGLHSEFGKGRLSGGGDQSTMPEERRAKDVDKEAVAEMVEALKDMGMYRGTLPNGMVSVKCPWQHKHKSTKGQLDPELDKTVLMPPGLGGFSEWGFRCVHDAGHGNKTFEQFTEALGLVSDAFPVLAEPKVVERPMLHRTNNKGISPGDPLNLRIALEWEGLGVYLMADDFYGTTLIAFDDPKNARELRDTDYTEIQVRMDLRLGIPKATTTAVREAVRYVASLNRRDAAIEWASGLVWDGEDRISRIHTDVLGATDDPYSHAVVRYLFTALAGRCISPGCKADMVPVLIGQQGCRKSTFIERLAPLPGSYGNINLGSRDDDLSRTLRGKLVVESGELRGFGARDEESLKDWITKREETWVPKFQEHVQVFPRRFVLIGSTNTMRFLTDPSGARRWLPLTVCKTRSHIDTDFIEEHRDQIWAQALHEYKEKGIAFRQAELLAVDEHAKHYAMSGREAAIREWLASRDWKEWPDGFNSVDVARSALGVNAHSSVVLRDVDRALLRLGFVQDDLGKWNLSFL